MSNFVGHVLVLRDRKSILASVDRDSKSWIVGPKPWTTIRSRRCSDIARGLGFEVVNRRI